MARPPKDRSEMDPRKVRALDTQQRYNQRAGRAVGTYTPPVHGEASGVHWHKNRGEPPCPLCAPEAKRLNRIGNQAVRRRKQLIAAATTKGPCPDCSKPAWVNPETGGWEHIDGRIRPHQTPTRREP